MVGGGGRWARASASSWMRGQRYESVPLEDLGDTQRLETFCPQEDALERSQIGTAQGEERKRNPFAEDRPAAHKSSDDLPRGDASTLQTAANIMKSYMGSGILGLPYAFRMSGLMGGMVVTLIVAVMATHCMILLVQAKDMLRHRGAVSFSDIACQTLGRKVGLFIDSLLCFMQYGFCVVYLVFVTDNLSSFFRNHAAPSPAAPNITLDDPSSTSTTPSTEDQPFRESDHLRLYTMLAVLPVFVALSLIKTLRGISAWSAIANCTIITGLAVILIASFIQITDSVVPTSQAFALTVKWETLPVMCGVSIYAFEGIGLVLPCQCAMKQPEKFPKVLTLCLVLATIIYSLFGTIPYVAFGEDTGLPNGQITDNLQRFAEMSTDPHVWLRMQELVRVCLILSITLTFPVQLFVVCDIVEKYLFQQWWFARSFPVSKQNLFRTLLVMVGGVIALLVPRFGPLVSLVGSFGGAALSFIFPPLFVLYMPGHTPSFAKKWLLWVYVLFGVAAGVFGTVQAVQELVT